jgi:hypothetical protein
MPSTDQMGHSKIETTKNIYGHLFAQDRAQMLKAINEAVSRLYVQEGDSAEEEGCLRRQRTGRPPRISRGLVLSGPTWHQGQRRS